MGLLEVLFVVIGLGLVSMLAYGVYKFNFDEPE